MPLQELEQRLQERAERRPAATSIAMLDGYVTAIVAGPVSISPLDWICPLLAVEADAFNHGGTPEFAAITPSRATTTTSAKRSRPLRTGSSRSTGASRTAMSTRVPGARDSMPPCGCDCRPGRRCST
jgi:hypothetical protein